MKLDLQVVSSVAIRRKKPSSRFSWLGKEKENIFILEDRRVLVLYLPSGNTKSFSSKLSNLVKDAVFATDSENGMYLIGILKDGGIFIWCKDADTFDIIETPRVLANYFRTFNKTAFAHHCVVIRTNEDASKMIVASRTIGSVHIWSKNVHGPHQEINSAGCWTSVDAFSPQGCSAYVDAVFPSKQDFGDTGFCTLLHNDSSVCHVETVHMKWPLTNSALRLPHTVECHRMSFALSELNLPQTGNPSHVSYLARYSHVGDLLAVAVNHRSVVQSSIMFVSPLSKSILVTDLKLERVPHMNLNNRRYWVNCLSWSVDDTFVVFITKLGAVGVVSRAGNLVSISSHGCNVENSPSRMIYFHPYLSVRNSEAVSLNPKPDDSAMSSTYDVLHQRFSVKCHQRMPVFLCSDGYMVTCLKIPQSKCSGMGLVAALIAEAQINSVSLRKLLRLHAAYSNTGNDTDLINMPEVSVLSTFSNTLREGNTDTGTAFNTNLWESSAIDAWHSQLSFEDESSVCDNPMAGLECATLHFDTVNSSLTACNQELQSQQLDKQVDSLIRDLVEGLLSSWGAIATSSDLWCKEWQMLAINNALLFVKLFKMMVQYRGNEISTNSCVEFVLKLMSQILAVARFDATWKQLTAITIDIVEGMVRCLLTQVYVIGDVLLGILKRVELSLRDGSQWLPCVMPIEPSLYEPSNYCMKVYSSRSFPETRKVTSTVCKRMAKIYKLIYKAMVKSYAEDPDVCKLKLVCKVQCNMEKLGVVWNVPKKKLNKGTIEWLHGNRKNAVAFWEQQLDRLLQMKRNGKEVKRIMVTILYAYLWDYDIFLAMQRVFEWRKLSQEDRTYLKTVNVVLRCLGRFIASYFANMPLHIYPPYVAKELPSLIAPTPSGCRRCCLSRDKLKFILNDYNISRNFSLDVAVELLISGFAISEAVWLCYQVGDWKTAYLLAVLCAKTRKATLSTSYRLEGLSSSFQLPPHLQPAAIMFDILQFCIGSNSASSKLSHQALLLAEDSVRSKWVEVLRDCFTASVLSNLSITSCLLQRLLIRLKVLVLSLEAKVDSDVYLPAPPVYCQQQISAEDVNITPGKEVPECETRMRISSLVHMIITVMKASNCVIPLCSFYLTKITKNNIGNTMENYAIAELKLAVDPLMQELEIGKASSYHNLFEHDSFLTMLWVFQDLIALLWLIHARDAVSRNFRKLQNILECPGNGLGKDCDPTVCCHTGLNWAQHLVPFAKCMDWDSDVDDIIISFVLESCESPLSAAFLAKRFPDITKIPPELETRMRIILRTWRKTVIRTRTITGSDNMELSVDAKSPKAKKLTTLFLFHLEMCDEAKQQSENLYKQLTMQIDDDVYFESSRPSADKLLSDQLRAFEVHADFHKFLATFFEVALLKDELNHASSKGLRIPVEVCFAEEHRQHHFDREISNVISKLTCATYSIKSDYSSQKKFNSSNNSLETEAGGLFRRKSFQRFAQSTPKKMPTNNSEHTLASGSRWKLQKRKLERADPKRYPVKRTLYSPKNALPNLCLTTLSNIDVATFSGETEEVCKLMYWLMQWSNRNHSILGSGNEHQIKVVVNLLPLAQLAQTVFDGGMKVQNVNRPMRLVEDTYGFGKKVLVEHRNDFVKIASDVEMEYECNAAEEDSLTYTVEDSISPLSSSSYSDDTLTSVTPLDCSLEESTDQHDGQVVDEGVTMDYKNDINIPAADNTVIAKQSEKMIVSSGAVEETKSSRSQSEAYDYNSHNRNNSKKFACENLNSISEISMSNSADDTLRDVDSPVSSSTSNLLSIEKASRNFTQFASRSHIQHLRVQRSHSDTKLRIPYLLRLPAEREDGSSQFDLQSEKKISFRFPLRDTGNEGGLPRLLRIPDEIRPKHVVRSQSTVEDLKARTKLIPLESIYELQKRFLDLKPTQNVKLLRTELEEFEILERVSQLRQKRRTREAERRNLMTDKETVERASSPFENSDKGKPNVANDVVDNDKEPFRIPKHMILPRSLTIPATSTRSAMKTTNLKHAYHERVIPSYAELNYLAVKKLQEAEHSVKSSNIVNNTTDASTSPNRELCVGNSEGTQCDYEIDNEICEVKVIQSEIMENVNSNKCIAAKEIGVNTELVLSDSMQDVCNDHMEKVDANVDMVNNTLEDDYNCGISDRKEVGVNTVTEMLSRTTLTGDGNINVGEVGHLNGIVESADRANTSLPLLRDIMEANRNSPWSPIRKSTMDQQCTPKPSCLKQDSATKGSQKKIVKQVNVFEELAKASIQSLQELPPVPTSRRDKQLNFQRDTEQRKVTALALMKDIVSSHQDLASKCSTRSKVNKFRHDPKPDFNKHGKKYTLSKGLQPIEDRFPPDILNSGRNSVDSDDTDTLSPWIVPEEVQRILTAENTIAP